MRSVLLRCRMRQQTTIAMLAHPSGKHSLNRKNRLDI